MKKRSELLPILYVAAVLLFGSLAFTKPAVVAAATTLSIGNEQIVYTHDALVAKGLTVYPDGPFGAISNSTGGLDFYSANTGKVAKTTGTVDDPAQTVVYNSKAISGIPSGIDYAGIYFPYKDPVSGYLVAIVHLERYPLGNPNLYWPSYGLAYSADSGSNWTYMGEVVQINIPYDPNVTTGVGHEIGPGTYVLVNPPDDPTNTYMYVYAFDHLNSDRTSLGDGASVSRAKLSDIVYSAVNHTAVPTFRKYYSGTWTQPGMGGLFSNIVDDHYSCPDVVKYDSYLNKYIMGARDYNSGDGQVSLRTSSDPINFIGADRYPIPTTNDINVYPSLIGFGSDPNNLGSTFNLFYVAWPQTFASGDSPWKSTTYVAKRVITVKDTNIGQSFNASVGFSSTMGLNNWYYQYLNGSNYSNMTWDSVNSRWSYGSTYSIVGSNWMHPDGNDSARVFNVPQSGTVEITGNIAMGQGGGDGVNVKIMKTGKNGFKQIWPASGWQYIASTDGIGVNVDVFTNVWQNENIYFVVNKNGNSTSDYTSWNPTVTYVSKGIWQASREFGSTQGGNNWSYKAVDFTTNTHYNMTWNSTNNYWSYNGTYSIIASYWMHPDATNSERVWTAPKAGFIYIRSGVSVGVGGDGINVYIQKNGSQIYPATNWQYLSADTHVSPNLSTFVNVGDTIAFFNNKNNTNSYDTTNFDPIISYQ